MTVLATKKTWATSAHIVRVRPTLASELAPEESAAVKRALLFLRARHGCLAKLAGALGVGRDGLARAFTKRGKVGALLALRAARLAGVPVEAVLSGAWPAEGACPHCGR